MDSKIVTCRDQTVLRLTSVVLFLLALATMLAGILFEYIHENTPSLFLLFTKLMLSVSACGAASAILLFQSGASRVAQVFVIFIDVVITFSALIMIIAGFSEMLSSPSAFYYASYVGSGLLFAVGLDIKRRKKASDRGQP